MSLLPNPFHRAVVKQVKENISIPGDPYVKVKVTFMLLAPGYVGEEIEHYFCVERAGSKSWSWDVKEDTRFLAKLLSAAWLSEDAELSKLVDSVVLIQMWSRPVKRLGMWVLLADVKSVEPTQNSVDSVPDQF